MPKKNSPLGIDRIAKTLGLNKDEIEPYGKYKAKIPLELMPSQADQKGNLILVTSMSPTPQGEGKTTLSIGLTDALCRLGEEAVVALREPSLGPIFGKKGGATGGGMAQVLPMEDINLHFNGDFAAIEKSNNLLAALLDNYIRFQGREFQIDPRTIVFKRVMDVNDRSLRKVITGLGGVTGGIPIETGFNITAASEIMAILCLSESLTDLKQKIGNIFVGKTFDGNPVYMRDLKFEGAATLLLKEAIKPNLVQTMEGNPALIHGGPFANIATGTNSLLATKLGLGLRKYVVTEAGFGADLGAEKFFNIICRKGNLTPSVAVLLFSIKALEFHGEGNSLEKGFENLKRHYFNCKKFGISVIPSLNLWEGDEKSKIKIIRDLCEKNNMPFTLSDPFNKGGKGVEELAKEVIKECQTENQFQPTYKLELPIMDKINHLAKEFYGAGKVKLTPKAQKECLEIEKLGLGDLPICMAKSPQSFSADPHSKGAPKDFDFLIRDFEFSSGAGFIIPMAGNIMRMPAYSRHPSAENMDIDGDGVIQGLN